MCHILYVKTNGKKTNKEMGRFFHQTKLERHQSAIAGQQPKLLSVCVLKMIERNMKKPTGKCYRVWGVLFGWFWFFPR